MDAEARFRRSVRELVDVVFTEDMEYFDALPGKVDRELGTPLAALVPMVDDGAELGQLVGAAQLVEEVAAEIADAVPADLSRLISAMSKARLDLLRSR